MLILLIIVNDKNLYYKYLWWGFKRDENNYDFFVLGANNQVIYLPLKNLIIVRNGTDSGEVDFWPKIFYEFASMLS